MPTDDTTATWYCEAYGAEAATFGALCFFAEPGERVCRSKAECTDQLAGKRQRVFRRINEMAAAGDETAAYLAEEFTNPEQLLGGDDSRPEGNGPQP